MSHQEVNRVSNGVDYGTYDAKALERRVQLYWRISQCYHDRLDTASQATMTVGKANKYLMSIKLKTQPNTLIHKVCERLHQQIINNNA